MVHRWSGGSLDDWRPWLKEALVARGFEVFVPEMPDTNTPIIEKWVERLGAAVGTPDPDTYLIDHSIGCQTILRYLETLSSPVGGAVFVAGWFNLENMEDDETRAVARPWIETPIDAEKVGRLLPKSILLISKDDPYSSFEENVAKFNKVGAQAVVFEHAGHFTKSEEPAILSEFEKLLL